MGMIIIPPLRTKRFTAYLKELTLGEAIAVASVSPEKSQLETTRFLSYVVEKVEGKVTNPDFWTVEERSFAVCQYLAVTNRAEPDFPIGDGHYSDYLDGSADNAVPDAPVFIGELKVEGDTNENADRWFIRPLTGRYASAIERIQGEIKTIDGKAVKPRFHWILGAMASQLVLESKNGTPYEPSEAATDSEIDSFLVERINIFIRYPISEFSRLLELYLENRTKLYHLFKTDFGDTGIVYLPREADGRLPPATFPVSSSIPSYALSMA